MLRPDRLRNTNIVNEIRNGFNIDFSRRLLSVILFSAFSFRDFWMFSISYLMKLSSEPWSHLRASLAFELSPAIILAELKCLGLGASHLLSNTSAGSQGRGTFPWWRGWPGPSWPLPAATSWASSPGRRSGALRSLAARIKVAFYYHFPSPTSHELNEAAKDASHVSARNLDNINRGSWKNKSKTHSIEKSVKEKNCQ